MKKILLLPALGLALLPLLSTSPSSNPAQPPAVKGYAIDAGHSTVLFRVQHLGVSNFWGRFNGVSGSFVLDEADPSNSSIAIEIETRNVDTFSEGRDKHLRSPDFFDVKRYPKITFESTSVAKADGGFAVTGNLSYHGVEKEVTTRADLIGAAVTTMGDRAGVEARFTIRRTDYGDTKYVDEGALGDEVLLIVSLEGIAE